MAQHVQSKLRDDGDYDAAGDGDGRHPAVGRAECPSHPLVETALAGIVQGHGPEQRGRDRPDDQAPRAQGSAGLSEFS